MKFFLLKMHSMTKLFLEETTEKKILTFGAKDVNVLSVNNQ